MVCEAINPSNHNVLYLQFDFNISLSVYSCENVSHNCNYILVAQGLTSRVK